MVEMMKYKKDLNENERNVIIKKLPKTERILVEEAFTFPENSAGRLMQRDFLAFPEFWTVGQTIDHMRKNIYKEEKNFYSIFITDPKQRILVFVFFASFPKKTQQVNKLFFSIEFSRSMIFFKSFFRTIGFTPEINILLE